MAEGKAFAQLDKDNPGKAIGSPHVRIGLVFLKQLGEMTNLDKDFAQMLKKWWMEQVANKNPAEVEGELGIFKVRKPQTQTKTWRGAKKDGANGDGDDSGNYARIQFSFKSRQFQKAMATELKRLGAVRKVGIAPKGYNERIVLDILKGFAV